MSNRLELKPIASSYFKSWIKALCAIPILQGSLLICTLSASMDGIRIHSENNASRRKME
jgi:hypothetical protein